MVMLSTTSRFMFLSIGAFWFPVVSSFQLRTAQRSIPNTNQLNIGGSNRLFQRSKTTHTTQIGLAAGYYVEKEGEEIYDLIVIGAGPVGVQAAVTAASTPFNKKVCLVDAPRCSGVLMDEENDVDLSIGGPTGLFSKALRDTSKRVSVSALRGMGLREDSIWNEITASCLNLASANSNDVRRQLDFTGVTFKEGFASFNEESTFDSDIKTLNVSTDRNPDTEDEILKTRNVLIATGSKPFRPNGIPFDGVRMFDSDSINSLSYLPTSIAITGSGIIAIEFAKIFRNLGAEVTLIIRDQVPRNALMKIGLDIDIAATLVADLVRSGIKVERGAVVSNFDVPENNARAPIKLTLEAAKGGPRSKGSVTELKCDAYLAAVGRKPNTENINMESAGIDLDEYGGIRVGSDLATSARNVYAAGDVLGRPFLASTGVAQAASAIQIMFGTSTETTGEMDDVECNPDYEICIDGDLGKTGAAFDPTSLAANPFAFPVGIWSSPEAAYYGLSKQQAKESGIETGEGIALYAECLRGLVFSPNGLLKLVFEKSTGRILGVHICGDDACELIHYGMELVRAKRTIKDIISNVYSAVTFHEMYRIAAMAGIDEKAARKRRIAAGAALQAANRSRMAKLRETSR